MITPSVFPATLHRTGIFSPAGSVLCERRIQGGAALAQCGLTVIDFDSESSPAYSYLSAFDSERAAAFNRALNDASIDLLWPLRGGYGCMRILQQIEWEKFNGRPYIGFSDNTAILLAMCTKKVGKPIAGVHSGRFDESMNSPMTLNSLRWALNPQGVFPLPLESPPKVLKGGSASGALFPVNLSTFCALIGTPWMPPLSGAVLLVEDIGEPVRKIDRMLCQLELCGILDSLAGLLFGQFTEMETPGELEQLMRETAQKVNGPVLGGIPFGHGTPTLCLPMGGRCEIREAEIILFSK